MTRTVMVIDDDDKTLRISELLIRSFGYSPILVNDPRSGLEKIADEPPSLILLDLMMPSMNGLQFLDERRKIPGAMAVPVVIFSAWKLNEEELSLYRNDIAEIALKPVEPARLKRILKQHLG